MTAIPRRAVMLLFLCLAAAGGEPSEPPAKASTVPIEKMRQVNGIPLALLSSSYSYVEESGVTRALPDRWAVLVFHPSGAAFLMLGSGKQEEDKAYEAKFSYSRGELNLRFASRKFGRNVSFPLDLAASRVTMPFRVFSAGKGTSTWERKGSDDRLVDNLFSLCDAIVLARKTDPDTTTVLLGKYFELFAHPAGTPEIDVSPAPPIFSMISFKLTAGSLGVKLGEPDGPDSFGGDFCSCFEHVSSEAGSSPCSGSERMTCTPKGCRCSGGEEEIQVIAGNTTVTGSCERAIIDEVVSRRLKEVRSCYRGTLPRPRKPCPAGEVAVSFTIDSTGAVSEANVARSTIDNNGLDRCINSSIRRWKFPQPKDGGACMIDYTFIIKDPYEDW